MKTTQEIIIKNGKTEIAINEKTISVSAPDIFITVLPGEESTSATIVDKDGIYANVANGQKMLFTPTDSSGTKYPVGGIAIPRPSDIHEHKQ